MYGMALVILALSTSSPGYASQRDTAAPVSNLGRWLEHYVGDCDSNDPSFNKKACDDAAADEQKKLNGKLLLIEIEPEGQVTFNDFDNQKGAYRLLLAPFFGERAVAMSVGKPEKLSKDGLPVVKNVPIWVKLPKGEEDIAFRRQLERGMVRLEMLVRPRKAWRMKRKDGDGDYRGVDVALVGLRVYSDRGDVLAEQTY